MRFVALALVCALGCGDDHPGAPDAAPDAGPLDQWAPVFAGLADGALTSGWATGDELFVVGGKDLGGSGGAILHYDGHAWTRMTNPAPALIWWVYGFSRTDVWAVGQQGATLHYDGSMWSLVPSGSTASLSGIWGADGGELWAVGGSDGAPILPVLMKWNGTRWSAVDVSFISNGGPLYKVWGTDRSHVWVVGDKGVVLSFDGNNWTQAPRATSGQLITDCGSGSSDVWAVGGVGNAAVLHFDGASWTPLQDTGLLPPLLGCTVAPDGTLIVVGRQGFIATRSGTSWHTVDMVPTTDCLHNVTPYAGGYVALGGNLLSPASGLHGVMLRSGSPLATSLP